MKYRLTVWLIVSWVCGFQVLHAWNYSTLPADQRKSLESGEAVIFSTCPDDGAEPDERFLTAGRLIAGTRNVIWAVINDKEDAETFVDGILDSEVVEQEGSELVVKQRTQVGGPKSAYTYTLRYVLTPETKAVFTYIKGEVRNVEGAWWIFDGPDESTFLVVYSLHIDPGVFAPQFVVKSGQKKSMPGTLISMDREVQRRMTGQGAE